MNKQTPATATINVGDIYYDSWGYEQTNVGFYKVVKKTPSTVTCIEINKDYSQETWGSGKVVPVDAPRDGRDEPFTKRVKLVCGEPRFNSPWHGLCFPYDGAPVYTSSWA
jgi:hypothetical protein